MQIWGNGESRDFDFGKQGKMPFFQGSKGTGTTLPLLWQGLIVCVKTAQNQTAEYMTGEGRSKNSPHYGHIFRIITLAYKANVRFIEVFDVKFTL